MADPSPGEIRQKIHDLAQNMRSMQTEIQNTLRNPTAFIKLNPTVQYRMMQKRAQSAQQRAQEFWQQADLESFIANERLVHDVNQQSQRFIDDLTIVGIQLQRLSLADMETDQEKHQAFQQWAQLDARAQEINEVCSIMYEELFQAFPDLPIDEPNQLETPIDVQDMDIVSLSSSTRTELAKLSEMLETPPGPDPFGSKFSDSEEEEEDLTTSRRIIDEKLYRAKEAITVNEQAIDKIEQRIPGFLSILTMTSETEQHASDKRKLSDLRDEQAVLHQQVMDLTSERNAILAQLQGQ
jgi:hypothetical protein